MFGWICKILGEKEMWHPHIVSQKNPRYLPCSLEWFVEIEYAWWLWKTCDSIAIAPMHGACTDFEDSIQICHSNAAEYKEAAVPRIVWEMVDLKLKRWSWTNNAIVVSYFFQVVAYCCTCVWGLVLFVAHLACWWQHTKCTRGHANPDGQMRNGVGVEQCPRGTGKGSIDCRLQRSLKQLLGSLSQWPRRIIAPRMRKRKRSSGKLGWKNVYLQENFFKWFMFPYYARATKYELSFTLTFWKLFLTTFSSSK